MGIIYIVHVVNNTSETVHYKNLESGHEVTVPPKDKHQENNDWIPSSTYKLDPVPKKSSSKVIRITVGDHAPFQLSDDRWKLSFVDFPDGDTREGVERRLGDFNGGEKLVLRVDGLRNEETRVAATVYKVDDPLRVEAGYVVASTLFSLATVVTLVLMAVFL
ncbi:hypothetical protein DHEL01_v207919 [Diaporthe helianthi]|uniref:Uncharacterized protein n=1 Tax=Diaporthe helianthi TaxID=158607 RepID=A0A2P5HTX0_DIAHE|nr:hypothetical protein DHEL01_v207919 [Diaporthe helianthi]